jgi:hypothetical protein
MIGSSFKEHSDDIPLDYLLFDRGTVGDAYINKKEYKERLHLPLDDLQLIIFG